MVPWRPAAAAHIGTYGRPGEGVFALVWCSVWGGGCGFEAVDDVAQGVSELGLLLWWDAVEEMAADSLDVGECQFLVESSSG